MAQANDTAAIIRQNLADAGCDDETTARCMDMVMNGNPAGMLPVLKKHRADLLREVHAGQKQIDCLDFLIFKLQRQEKGVL